MKPIYFFILALVFVQNSANSQFKIESFRGHAHSSNVYDSWPCPVPEDIVPCGCISKTDFNGITTLEVDCSNVTSENDLKIAFQAVFPFRKIEFFYIVHDQATSGLTQLSDGVFNGVSFERVTIKGTAITSIGDNVFADSYNSLVSLYVDENSVSSFPFESLENFEKLAVLYLEDNQIAILPPIVSKSLTILSMSGNYGIILAESTDLLGKVPNINLVLLQRCGLTDLNGIFSHSPNYLEDINVSGNELTTLPANSFTFGNNSRYTNAYFANNNISSVEANFAVGMKPGGMLYGNNNSFEYVYEDQWKDVFTALDPGGIIDLSGNSLLCGCEEAWIASNPNYATIFRMTNCYDGTNFTDITSDVYNVHCPADVAKCSQ